MYSASGQTHLEDARYEISSYFVRRQYVRPETQCILFEISLSTYFLNFTLSLLSHNLEHNSIACVREEVAPNSFRTLSGRETLQQQGIHLIRVPTVDAALQEHWFIDQIHAARAMHLRTRTPGN